MFLTEQGACCTLDVYCGGFSGWCCDTCNQLCVLPSVHRFNIVSACDLLHSLCCGVYKLGLLLRVCMDCFKIISVYSLLLMQLKCSVD